MCREAEGLCEDMELVYDVQLVKIQGFENHVKQ